jgi:hypothetical protein
VDAGASSFPRNDEDGRNAQSIFKALTIRKGKRATYIRKRNLLTTYHSCFPSTHIHSSIKPQRKLSRIIITFKLNLATQLPLKRWRDRQPQPTTNSPSPRLRRPIIVIVDWDRPKTSSKVTSGRSPYPAVVIPNILLHQDPGSFFAAQYTVQKLGTLGNLGTCRSWRTIMARSL